MLPPAIARILAAAAQRRAELEQTLGDPNIASQQQLYRRLSRQLGELGKLLAVHDRYIGVAKEIEDNRQIAQDGDAELAQLAREEIQRLQAEAGTLEETLIDRVLAEDEDPDRSVILEIRAGTGGDEAALFVADLLRMYSKFADRKGWRTELLDTSPTELGGFREVVLSVSGESVNRDLRYEMGGHRVQRVPETEASGRIHTSAATVAVMSEPEEVEIAINDADLRIDFYRASGPGGQKVNKTSSAVRITHLPTGTVVAIQDETSQHKNKAKAMRVLRTRIYEAEERKRLETQQSIRRGQIGSGDRNQRIRTYNFPQNRVTDHRIHENFNLERVLEEGDLDPVIHSLRGFERAQRLEELEP